MAVTNPMNLQPKTTSGRVSRALIYLFDARISPEILKTNAFTELFKQGDGNKVIIGIAQRITKSGELTQIILSEEVKPHCEKLWIQAASAARKGTPMLFPEYEENAV